MKYSIILPYYKRRDHLYNTLITFKHHYNKYKYEVIIIEDYKNYEDGEEHQALYDVVDRFNNDIVILVGSFPLQDCHNPAPLYNIGANVAHGKFLIISSPECFHPIDILSGLDEEFDVDENCYIVCACEDVVGLEGKGKITRFENFSEFIVAHRLWFQHSKFNNRGFHFCSAISKEKYLEIGGFDENFGLGIAYDDNDFRDNIVYHNIPIKLRDDLVVCHMSHEYISVPNYRKLVEINKGYYFNKLNKRNIKLEFDQ